MGRGEPSHPSGAFGDQPPAEYTENFNDTTIRVILERSPLLTRPAPLGSRSSTSRARCPQDIQIDILLPINSRRQWQEKVAEKWTQASGIG